jgi:hypothetical protein
VVAVKEELYAAKTCLFGFELEAPFYVLDGVAVFVEGREVVSDLRGDLVGRYT